MATAKAGDKVRIHYTGTLEDGNVFDSSREREPFEFVLGGGQVIPGFEHAVTGMSVEDRQTVKLTPQDAYGERREDMVLTLPVDQLPDGLDPKVGQMLRMGQPGGQELVVQVAAIDDKEIQLDGNHPLAGKALTFDIELLEILENDAPHEHGDSCGCDHDH